MLSQSHFLSLNPNHRSSLFPIFTSRDFSSSSSSSLTLALPKSRRRFISMSTSTPASSNGTGPVSGVKISDSELDEFAVIAYKLADAAGDVIRKYFRKRFDIVDKQDLS